MRSPTCALGLSLLMLTLVFVGLGQARSPHAARLTRVTTASESDRGSFAPVLGADGRRIAFQSDSDFLGQGIPRYQTEIWLYDTMTMTLTRVTMASDPDAHSGSSSLSADGTWMAFHSTADFLDQGIPYYQYEIWLYDTTGMTFTRVTTASGGDRASFAPSLSADGRRVAFCSDSDFLDQDIPKEQYEIWLYDTTTMTLTRVTTASEGDRDSFEPNLNADGTRIAFSSDSDFVGQGIPDEQYEIWLYDTATMTFTRVTAASESDRASHWPSLSADGTRIAFHSDSDFLGQGISRYQDEIWLYDTATLTLTRVTTASHGDRSSLHSSLSADGTRIAFHSDSDFLGQGIANDQCEIWLYDTTTVTFTRVTTASESNRDSFLASLNADGRLLAFYSDSDFLGQSILDNQFEIWLYDGYYRAYLPLLVRQSLRQ